jgi:uncharacterized membrane protein
MESDPNQSQIAESERIELVEKMVLDIISRKTCRKVGDVVSNLHKVDRSISEDEIHDAVRNLERKGAVSLSEEKIQASFVQSLLDPWTNLPLWAAVLGSALMIVSLYLLREDGSWLGVRGLVGAIFLFVLPGYVLAELLVQKDKPRVVERITVSIGLSLAAVVLIGSVLGFSEIGVRIDPIVAVLSAIIIAGAILVSYRSYNLRNKARRTHLNFLQNEAGIE